MEQPLSRGKAEMTNKYVLLSSHGEQLHRNAFYAVSQRVLKIDHKYISVWTLFLPCLLSMFLTPALTHRWAFAFEETQAKTIVHILLCHVS